MTIPSRHGPGCRCSCAPTDTELRIIAALADGIPVGRIAAGLHHTPATVATYIKRVRNKVGARTREQLVAVALRDQLIGFGPDGRARVLYRQEAAA